MEKHYRMQIFLGVVTLLILLLSFTYATYAWFSYTGDTNVEPLEGGIGYGEGDLLIADSPDGPFSDQCALNAIGEGTMLRPLSTADLLTFYTAAEQDLTGISTRFVRQENVAASAVSGSVYLKSEHSANAVYFDRNLLDFGSDGQALAAMRLGLVITTQNTVNTYIFRLDDMGGAANAEARQTIEQPGSVVASVSDGGTPEFAGDPAANISDYCAVGTENQDTMTAGNQMLCTLSPDEVARVDYYLYLEGCDENCINSVQGRQIALALGFAGILISAVE